MASPQPWSFSRLDSFISCPHSFHEVTVAKSVQSVQGEEAKWGEYVHKVFENHQKQNIALPADLAEHQDYMDTIRAKPGTFTCENKIGLTRKLQPCGFFDTEIWYRGIIDYQKISGQTAFLVDYKTGKPHNKFKQLSTFALHTFIEHPEVELVNAQYYWTKTCTTTKKVWARKETKELWAALIPDLKQYKEAFETDTWQKRQSGLCNGWCPVTSCEFWRPKRVR